jgi:transposase
MLALSAGTPVYLAVGATDLRKGFDGLHGLVESGWQRRPRCGEVFVFCNRRRDTIKLLCWEEDGRWVCAKRLERGSFAWPMRVGEPVVLTAAQLHLLLGGLELGDARQRPRWSGKSEINP